MTFKIGKRIRERRKELGITQTELAKRLNIGKVSVSNVENDRDGMTLERIQKYAEALNTSVQSLLDWDHVDSFENYLESLGIEVHEYLSNPILKEDESGNEYEEMPDEPIFEYDVFFHEKQFTFSYEEYRELKKKIAEYISFLILQKEVET